VSIPNPAMGQPWAEVDAILQDGKRDPRRAYRVVDDFEAELCAYTGAPFAVTVDSATNAIFLSLVYELQQRPDHSYVRLPRRMYVGVLQAARNAGYEVLWDDAAWDAGQNYYTLPPTRIVDAARRMFQGMFVASTLTCLSMHAAKQLPLGRGGAILTDDAAAAEWLRAARMDGRPPGAPIGETVFPGFHCPMPSDTAARGLWILSRWVDSGYDPPPLPQEEYPDLSKLEFTQRPGDA
jgi:dTDP-4-amino-4,6-dideoxygalactose transaminase